MSAPMTHISLISDLQLSFHLQTHPDSMWGWKDRPYTSGSEWCPTSARRRHLADRKKGPGWSFRRNNSGKFLIEWRSQLAGRLDVQFRSWIPLRIPWSSERTVTTSRESRSLAGNIFGRRFSSNNYQAHRNGRRISPSKCRVTMRYRCRTPLVETLRKCSELWSSRLRKEWTLTNSVRQIRQRRWLISPSSGNSRPQTPKCRLPPNGRAVASLPVRRSCSFPCTCCYPNHRLGPMNNIWSVEFERLRRR